jgi:polyisoprenoid-binding protein YceI
MKNKIFIAVGVPIILGVIVGIVVMNMDWGTVESQVKKTEVKNQLVIEGVKEVNHMSFFKSGNYSASILKEDNLELLFNIEGLKKTTGRFNDVSVNLEVPLNADSSVLEVVISTKSIFTDNNMRDESLISEDYFNADKFPEIRFKSSEISLSDTCLLALGQLEFLGMSNELVIPFNILGEGLNVNQKQVYITNGTFDFDRAMFGMESEKGIGDIVNITFYCEFIK